MNPNEPAGDGCPCSRCCEGRFPVVWWMVVCQKCGNKRCPHAADHRNECTNSNKPGQFHGYSGPCPKPPLPKPKTGLEEAVAMLEQAAAEWQAAPDYGDKAHDVACHFMEHTLPKVIEKLKA